MVIIENIMEDPIEVKYEDETISHNHQVPVDLLKMTTKYVYFLGVENFNFINPMLIDVANKLKVDEKKFYATLYEGFKFQSRIKLVKHSQVFVYLEWKISDFKNELKDKFISSEGVWCKTKYFN